MVLWTCGVLYKQYGGYCTQLKAINIWGRVPQGPWRGNHIFTGKKKKAKLFEFCLLPDQVWGALEVARRYERLLVSNTLSATLHWILTIRTVILRVWGWQIIAWLHYFLCCNRILAFLPFFFSLCEISVCKPILLLTSSAFSTRNLNQMRDYAASLFPKKTITTLYSV